MRKALYLLLCLFPTVVFAQTDPEQIMQQREMEKSVQKEKKKRGEVYDSTIRPQLYKDTLYTTSGYKLTQGQNIKIGVGAMPDGDFKFIRVNAASLFAYNSSKGYNGLANQANSLPRNQSGLKYEVKNLMKRGDDTHGYVYYAKIGLGIVNYEVDVENAIASGELDVPEQYKPKPKNIVVQPVQPISVADELTKLKKLLDDGVINKEEFDQQKKKLLNKN